MDSRNDASAKARAAYPVPRNDGVLPVLEINHGVYTNIVDDVDISWELALAIYYTNNRRIVEGARGCLAEKISIDMPICATINIYSSAPDFDDCAVCYSPVAAGGDHSRKSGTLYEVVLHVNCQVFHAPVIPGTKQKIARRNPGNLQDGHSAALAHQMNI